MSPSPGAPINSNESIGMTGNHFASWGRDEWLYRALNTTGIVILILVRRLLGPTWRTHSRSDIVSQFATQGKEPGYMTDTGQRKSPPRRAWS